MSDPTLTATPDVEIFDPPLCCPTGLCGPVLDTTLVDLGEALLARRSQAVTAVVRRQMASEPRELMRTVRSTPSSRHGTSRSLPITVVRGRKVKTDAYPTLDELRAALASA